jgi:hypothetical protein
VNRVRLGASNCTDDGLFIDEDSIERSNLLDGSHDDARFPNSSVDIGLPPENDTTQDSSLNCNLVIRIAMELVEI